MKIFYHGDLDGHCAGAIAYQYYRKQGMLPELHEAKYGMKLDNINIEPYELVIIVDFSFQLPGQFQELIETTSNIIWIDHHKTSLEEFKDLDLDGIRRDGTAGCELTWEYFHPTLRVPDVVKFIGDMDVWKWEYPSTEAIIEGLGLIDTRPDSPEWKKMLNPAFNHNELLTKGQTCLQYRNNYYKKVADNLSFESEWQGYKCIVCNCAYTGSPIFEGLENMKDYDIWVTFYYNGKHYSVSLYSDKDYVNCGELAHELGGGGHLGAAGFRCDVLPFVRSGNES